jgi:hypothetical protein
MCQLRRCPGMLAPRALRTLVQEESYFGTLLFFPPYPVLISKRKWNG